VRRLVSLAQGVLVLALLGAYLAYVFRFSDGTTFDAGLADWLDPYFINFLLENWYQSIRTLSDPASPPWFFPVRHTLSYSHGLILYVPFYVVPRLFGLHPFQAYTVTLMLIMATGTFSLYQVFRRYMRLSFVEALLLCALFLTSQNVINDGTSVWSQTASVFLVPPILLLGVTAAQKPPGRLRLMLAAVTGLLGSLLFVQDFYTGVFVVLIGGLVLVGAVAVNADRIGVASAVRLVVAALRPPPFDPSRHATLKWWTIVGVTILALAAVASLYPIDRTDVGITRVSVRDPSRPFFIAVVILSWLAARRYNVATRFGNRMRRTVSSWHPVSKRSRADIVLAMMAGGIVGAAVFSWLYLDMYLRHPVFPRDQLWNSIRSVSPARWVDATAMYNDLLFFDSARPFATTAVLLGVMVFSRDQLPPRWKLFGVWFAAIAVFVFVLPLSLGGRSIWETFIAPIPGLGVVRDPKRVIYVFELAVALAAGTLLMRLDPARWVRRITPVLLVPLLCFSWNSVRFRFDRPLSTFREWVERPIAINASCQSFFMKPASEAYTSRSGHQWSLYAVDAGFIALRTSIPTLNGYSAWSPDGWGGLANPRNEEYMPSVREWIQRNAVENVCELDIERRTMRPFK
jgi:hypothetical protein